MQSIAAPVIETEILFMVTFNVIGKAHWFGFGVKI
jgi:hypothetical protein